MRRFLAHVVLLIAAAISVLAQWMYRIAAPSAFVTLPWIATGAAIVMVCTLVGDLVLRLPPNDRVRRTVERIERAVTVLLLGFVVYGVVLALNAELAPRGPLQLHQARVVRVGGGEPDAWFGSSFVWADITSWRRPGGTERVMLWGWERDTLWGGQPVLVSAHPGRFGWPWILNVQPDDEARLRAVLRTMPTASRARKDLIEVYIRREQYEDATAMAREYFVMYPADSAFAKHFAGELINASRWPDAVPILEPFARRKPDAAILGQLGFAMTRAGRHTEGIGYLERSVALAPDDWWPAYALGNAHFYRGELQEAVPAFQRVLQLRQNFPEIEERLATIQAQLAARRQ